MSGPRFARIEIVGATIAALTVIAFSILLLAHDSLIFWNDDYEISILPVFADMAGAWNHGGFPWLPWAWWAAERALDPERSRWRFLWPAPFVYLLITGGFPYTVLMLALVLTWLTLRGVSEGGNVAGPAQTRPHLARLTKIG